MTFFENIRDALFPWPDTDTVDPPERVSSVEVLAKDPDLSMEIAIRLHDAEVQRRQTADTKAAIYLAFLAAILPIIGALTPTVSGRFQAITIALDTAFFAIALIYFFAAAWFAVKAISASKVVALDENDLNDALQKENSKARVASQLVEATRQNYPLNNKKITYVSLTQQHIFRAFLAIMVLVAMDWGSDVLTALAERDLTGGMVPAIDQTCLPFNAPSQTETILQYSLKSDASTICLPISLGETE